MTRSTNMEHVAHLHRMANEAWRGSPEHAALTAAIASLSAQQPPAEAQPCGCGEATCTVPWEPGCGLGKSEQHAVVEDAPPSAPVGVDALEVFRIAGGDTECEPNPTPERALEVLRDLRACYDESLAQQPSPDGGFTAADMMDARQEGRKEAQQG